MVKLDVYKWEKMNISPVLTVNRTVNHLFFDTSLYRGFFRIFIKTGVQEFKSSVSWIQLLSGIISFAGFLNSAVFWNYDICQVYNLAVFWNYAICQLLNTAAFWNYVIRQVLNSAVFWNNVIRQVLNSRSYSQIIGKIKHLGIYSDLLCIYYAYNSQSVCFIIKVKIYNVKLSLHYV